VSPYARFKSESRHGVIEDSSDEEEPVQTHKVFPQSQNSDVLKKGDDDKTEPMLEEVTGEKAGSSFSPHK
jgi:hypothetical protein